MTSDIDRIRQELADHDARENAAGFPPRPPWKVALDDLLIANYANDAFWKDQFWLSLYAHFDDDEDRIEPPPIEHFTDVMQSTRAWYAGKCRICERPMHKRDLYDIYGGPMPGASCRWCGATVISQAVIEGSTVGAELEP